MKLRRLAWIGLSLLLAVVGYFFFGIVVAISAGLWLHDEKMYFAQGLSAHIFGAVGATVGVLLTWSIHKLAAGKFHPLRPTNRYHGTRANGT